MIWHSKWTKPVVNKHPEQRGSTNWFIGAYETFLSHQFLVIGVLPLIPIGFVQWLVYKTNEPMNEFQKVTENPT
jgi:hypothetical protein